MDKHLREIDKKEIIADWMETDEIKSLTNIAQTLFDFYNKSVILKNLGSFFMVDPTISALSEKISQSEVKRINKLMTLFKERVTLLEKEKVDRDFIQTEEFARVVFNTLENAKKDYRENKLNYYANILANYSTIDYSDMFSKESILDRIGKYDEMHILVLYSFDLERRDLLLKGYSDIEDMSREIREVCISDLSSDGLLKELTGSYTGYIGGSYSITDMGKQCINLIIDNS